MEREISRTWWAAVVASFAAVSLMAPADGRTAAPPALRFGPPVRVSGELSEAWEPVLLNDRFGNIFVHARKTLTQLVLAPDDRSPTQTRSMSWVWVSSDDGRTFGNIPGYPLDAQSHNWGYEGDFALDGAGHLYFVDQQYADSTITRWTVTGRGEYAIDFHRPLIPTAQPVEDRPWLAAHGEGNVFYTVNAGDAALNPTGRDGGDAYGAGRYSVYRSTDGANSFEPVGHSLKDSGGCRPAADKRPGAQRVYIVCTNDGVGGAGIVWAFVSADNGATYTRYRIGDYNAAFDTFDWPLVTVGPNGDVWVLHIDARQTGGVLTNTMNLYRSTDHGRTWSTQEITPRAGRYRWGWLAVSPAGELGLAIQHRPDTTAPWRAYAGVFSPGSVPALSSIDEANPVDGAASPEPPSELMGLIFMPNQTIGVAWTRVEAVQGREFLRVYFARSLPPAPKPPVRRPVVGGVRRERGPLPATGLAESGLPGVFALVAATVTALWLGRSNGRRPVAPSTVRGR